MASQLLHRCVVRARPKSDIVVSGGIVVDGTGAPGRNADSGEPGWRGWSFPSRRCQHHYLVTETIPEGAALDFEVPIMIDLEGYTYMRQELPDARLRP